jgi:hypothetical protein
MSDNKVAFDLWWEWAEKSLDSPLTIDAYIHDAVMALPPDERRDREKVTAAVRDGLRLGPLRPAGSADLYGVPRRLRSPMPARSPQATRCGVLPLKSP